jgi:hypothetical protein
MQSEKGCKKQAMPITGIRLFPFTFERYFVPKLTNLSHRSANARKLGADHRAGSVESAKPAPRLRAC